tara:strand:- start:10998 stop:11891 length:894 start_codon:yes stop_codon:yes gene_type:complete
MLNLKKFFLFLFKNPQRLLALFLIKILPNEIIKKKVFNSKIIKKKLFLLSFDCDTQKDIDSLENLLKKLKSISFKIVLAIPGELVSKNINLIINLKNNYEIEFLNHGYYLHTELDEKTNIYKPIFSYENKDINFIKEDIKLAHDFFKDKLQIELKGFRAPHFGDINYRKKRKIFKYLKNLGYLFSSSSIYDTALFKGPIFSCEGITEITVTGCADKQSSILDSWSFLVQKDNKLDLSSEYIAEIKKLIYLFDDDKHNFINIYADPSHIINVDNFFNVLKDLVKFNLLNFRDIKFEKN